MSLTHYDGNKTQARIWHHLTDGWRLAPLPDQSQEECRLEQRALMAECSIILDRLEETMPASPVYLKKSSEVISYNLSANQGDVKETEDRYLARVEEAIRQTENMMGQQLDRATCAAMQKEGILDGLEIVSAADPETAEAAPTTSQPRLGFSPIYMQASMELEQELMDEHQKQIDEPSA